MSLECSEGRPWGVHLAVYNDEACPRCGWGAPGPISDAIEEAKAAAEEARARLDALGWRVLDAGEEDALAA